MMSGEGCCVMRCVMRWRGMLCDEVCDEVERDAV